MICLLLLTGWRTAADRCIELETQRAAGQEATCDGGLCRRAGAVSLVMRVAGIAEADAVPSVEIKRLERHASKSDWAVSLSAVNFHSTLSDAGSSADSTSVSAVLAQETAPRSGSHSTGDHNSTNVCVLNLPGDVTEAELGRHFARYGDVATVKVSTSPVHAWSIADHSGADHVSA